jgi:hypothetical protein
VHPVGTCARGKRRVIGNKPEKAALGSNACHHIGKNSAARRIPRPRNHETAPWQQRERGRRIGQPLVIREKGKCRQSIRIRFPEPPRRPCQLLARKAIRHAMSSPVPTASAAARNLADILARIDAARKAALSPASSTTLIAVSKTFGPEQIEPAIAVGQRVFGENRVQEAKTKWPALKAERPGIDLHLIGPLQSNKVHEAVQLFDAIHTIDRPKIAEALRHEIDKSGRAPLLFIQVNTGEEPQKAGVAPSQVRQLTDYCRESLTLPIFGLMCIPPANEAPAPHFALLAKIARSLGLCGLSMGMSADFETAIRFGATHLRIGTAIFGDRP